MPEHNGIVILPPEFVEQIGRMLLLYLKPDALPEDEMGWAVRSIAG
jgi:hypothetical protein